LTPDCVYEFVQTGHRWEGHDGAARFYTQLLTAFPDIRFDLTDIVIGPQGVCEEADVSATHEAAWLGVEPTGERVAWKVVIWFPWDEERRLFRGEKVYVSGIDLPALEPASPAGRTRRWPGTRVAVARWFRCCSFQTPSRVSPPYVRAAIDHNVSAGFTT